MRKIVLTLVLLTAALVTRVEAGVTLEGATDALELVTSSTSAIDYTCSWSNVTATALTTPGTTKGNVAAATTTTVIAAPAASNFRHVRKCWFHNDAGGSSNTLTVQIDVSATNRLLYAATLLAGEALSLTEDGDFILYDATGQKKPLLVTGGGTEATALRVTVANDSTGVLSVDDNGAALTVDAVNLDIRDLTATDVVTVTDGAGALNVIVDSSALPSGAATSANQDGIVRDGTGDTTQANVSTGRLHVDGSGVTQPVSGTVTVGTFPDNEPFNQAQRGGVAVVAGACERETLLYVQISQTTGTQLITGTASERIYLCGIQLMTATAQNVALVDGTGSVCATSPTGLLGGSTAATGWNFAANGGIVLPPTRDSWTKTSTDSDNVCLLMSAAGQVSGSLSYVSVPNI